MSPGTLARPQPVLWQLARPRTVADRKRALRMSAGVAGSGMFLLAALAILTVRGGAASTTYCTPEDGCVTELVSGHPFQPGLADYVTDDGLRGGTAFGALLMFVPFALLALQALRTGTAARERRLAALSLAGATRADLRRLAFLEGTRAAVLGALASGPAYIGLWLIFGAAMPDGAKMLPNPNFLLALGWLGLVLALGAAGGSIAWQSARPATVSPLGLTRRRARPLNRFDAILPVVCFVVGGSAWQFSVGRTDYGLLLMLAAILVFSISVGPWFILLTARLAARQRSLITSLAARRLLADVRTPGRGVAVMLAIGVAFGINAVLFMLVLTNPYGGEQSFYLYGIGASTIAAVLAAVVATSSLVVGATEQILDNARSTAILVALAASPGIVSKIVRRQLMLAAVPPTMTGALLAWAVYGWLLQGEEARQGWALLSFPLAVGLASLSAVLGALIATRAVRPAILSSSSPENLRTP